MYETLTYIGGVHKHEEMNELIEDLGGFVLQETTSQSAEWHWEGQRPLWLAQAPPKGPVDR